MAPASCDLDASGTEGGTGSCIDDDLPILGGIPEWRFLDVG